MDIFRIQYDAHAANYSSGWTGQKITARLFVGKTQIAANSMFVDEEVMVTAYSLGELKSTLEAELGEKLINDFGELLGKLVQTVAEDGV